MAATSPLSLSITSLFINQTNSKTITPHLNPNPNHSPILPFPLTSSCRQLLPDEAPLSPGPPPSPPFSTHHPSSSRSTHPMEHSSTDETIMAALLTLNSPQPLHPLAAELRLRHRRLTFLLLSPPHFSLALSHLRSLSLRTKSLLLARLLLRSLSLLQSPLRRPHRLSLRDFDAAVLLLAMCDSYHPSSAHAAVDWRSLIADRIAGDALSAAGLGGGWWPVIAPHVDAAAKCRRLVAAESGVAASPAAEAAAVVALEVADTGECAICGEEIVYGGAMPCGHPFHWGCILEWLRMRNTCPCCRFELPTVDVCCEIQRVWKMLVKMGG